MARSVEGTVVVVTGAASGLGSATARALSARGARLGLVDVDGQAVSVVATSLAGEALPLAADISVAGQIERAIGSVIDRYGRIDSVMAGAGISGWGPVLTGDPALWERTIEINVLGTWRTIRAALPHLVSSRGYLLLVSSGWAAAAGPAVSAYAASKAAIESLGRSLRVELRHHGVDVGVAYYTFLDTPMVRAMEANPAAMRLRRAMPRPVRPTFPLEKAVEATVTGIETRSDRIVHPSFLRWFLLSRGFFGTRSDAPLRRAMPEAEQLARSQLS